MAKSEKTKRPLVDMAEEEKWKIIEDSQVLKKVPVVDSSEPHLFIALLLSIPLIVCHAMFDYIVHLQFGYDKDFTLQRILKVQGPAWPALIILSYITNKFKHNPIAQIIYMLSAGAIGCLVIHHSEENGTFIAMSRTPGLIVVGILLIIQADLTYALLAVLIAVVYYYRTKLMDYWPSGSIPKLKPEL